MPTETALSRERAKRCDRCRSGSPTYINRTYGLCHPTSYPDPCKAGTDADLYEELAKERDTFAKALHDCLGILKIALSDMSGAFVNAVCEEELPRFERLDAIRAAREKEKA